MAGKSATLTVKIVSDAKGASQGFADAESRVDKFQRGLDKASVAAGGVLVGMGAVAKAAFDSASALQQSSGAIETVFGKQAEGMKTLAANAVNAQGLSANSYQELASVLGASLKNMGMADVELMATTNNLISTGADLAATFGGTTADAVNALSSLLRGERDPIERYGITMSKAAVDAQVAAMGLDTSTDAAMRNAEAQATLALVAQQSASAQGAFARESDTAAGAQQRAAAAFENAQAVLGEVLLPIVAKAMTQFASLTAVMAANKDVVIPLVAILGGMAVAVLAVNAAMRVYAAGQAIATAAAFLFGNVLRGTPIGIVITLIAGLVAAVAIAYNKFEGFRNVVKSVWEWLKKAFDFAGKVGSAIGGFFSAPAAGGATTAAAGGMYGAAPGAGEWAPIRGAAMFSPSGGTSPSAGRGQASVVNITIQGAIDKQGTADQIADLLRRRGVMLGSAAAVAL